MILLNYSTKYVQNKTKHDFMVYIFDMSTTNSGNNNAIRNIINMIVKSTRLLNLDETIYGKQEDTSEHCRELRNIHKRHSAYLDQIVPHQVLAV